MKELARSWRLTFGALQDSSAKRGTESEESNEESQIKPRELRIPVHHRTITTGTPQISLSTLLFRFIELIYFREP